MRLRWRRPRNRPGSDAEVTYIAGNTASFTRMSRCGRSVLPRNDARATMTALLSVAAFKGMDPRGARPDRGSQPDARAARRHANLRRGRCGRRRVRHRRRRRACSRRLARPQQQGPDVRGVRRRRDLRRNRCHREQHAHRRRRGGGPRAAAAHQWLRVPRRAQQPRGAGRQSLSHSCRPAAPDVGFCSATRRSKAWRSGWRGRCFTSPGPTGGIPSRAVSSGAGSGRATWRTCWAPPPAASSPF